MAGPETRVEGVQRRPLLAGMIGNFVEWYDFGIYGYLAVALSKNFFPGDGLGPLLSTFAVFGVAFVFRPLGGLVLGSLGDKIGRRSTLAGVVLTIAVATTLIGCLPTYQHVGWLAPVLLVLLRCVQGFAAGGEYGGATSFVFEYAPQGRRGLLGGFLGLSTYLSFLAGSLLAFVLTTILHDDAMLSWGWRVPFLAALPIGLVGLYLRLRVEDTPEFRKVQRADAVESAPLRASLLGQRGKIVRLFGFLMSVAVTPYLLITYIPTYLKASGGLSGGETLAATSAALVVLCFLLPVFGRVSDRVGRKPVMLFATLSSVVGPLPAFLLFQLHSPWAAFLGMSLIAIGQAACVSITAVVIAELFPTKVRYSSASITYNLAFMIFGGTAPLVATLLVSVSGSDIAPAFYVIAIAVVSTVFVRFLPETAPTKASAQTPRTATATVA